MFLFHGVLAVLLVVFAIICTDNGRTTVVANGISIINGPFLHIEKPRLTKILITWPQLQYEIHCRAEIEPAFFYQDDTDYFFTWYQNDTVLQTYKDRRKDFYLSNNGTLRLPANEKASGVYRCKINANRTALLSESITVVYPVIKRLQNQAGNVTLTVGYSYTFNCPVFSIPRANYTWTVGSITLNKPPYYDNRYLVLSNGSLIIRKVTLYDIGKYRCSAYNQYLNKTRNFVWSAKVNQLNEFSKITTTTTIAHLLPYLQNTIQYVPHGENCTLLCYGVNDLTPIEWWFQRTLNSEFIKLSNSSHAYNIDYASIENHEGYYTCKLLAYNAKQTFAVIVTTPPIVLEPLPSYETSITAAINFRCRIYGNPRPTITWYHNGDQLNSSFTRYINGNELVIHSFDPDENGIYQCFARNIAGEVYTAAEMRFKNRGDEELRENPLKNIRCFAHSFNTINITFDSQPNESLFIVHIVQSHPHRWSTPFPPMLLNHTSYMVIGNHLPIYRPFQLITRILFPTSEIRNGKKPNQQTILSSLRSPPVSCCTQGLLLHLMHLVNDTFVTWSQPDIEGIKYFVIQFAMRHTHPHPGQLLKHTVLGTMGNVELKFKDVTKKLTHIKPLSQAATQIIMQRAENRFADNEARSPSNLQDVEEEQGDIFNMVVYANVSGILLQHFRRIKLRVLIITKENEYLAQDFRYVQWKSIENNTSEITNAVFRLTTVESRTLTFHFRDGFNESCISVCHWQIQFPIISIKEEQKCEHKTIVNSLLEVRNLKPSERYRLHFYTCESGLPYGQLDVKTLPDPPGTISNHSVIRHEGLKLVWSPPKQQNGKIHHYNILWTLGNVTHEANVMECQICFYKFPNISESAKINVTVRVVGETGVGAPIFVDLRHINHHTLDVELSSNNSDVYSGIAIGSLLSTCCVCCFALLIIFQRRRFKARQDTPTHLTTPSEVNFSSLNNPSLPSGSAGGLSGGSTVQQDYYEMQNLIPKARRQSDSQLPNAATSPEFQVTHLLNGTNVLTKTNSGTDTSVFEQNSSNAYNNNNNNNNNNRNNNDNNNNRNKILNDRKPFFISLKNLPPGQTNPAMAADATNNQAQNSLPNSSSIMPLAAALHNNNRSAANNGLSKNNKSSCSLSSTSSSSKKAFSTNFPKHSNSYDGICLLVEEESVSTPTTEASESTMECVFRPLKEHTKVEAPSSIFTQSTAKDKRLTQNTQNFKAKHFNVADGKNRRPVIINNN